MGLVGAIAALAVLPGTAAAKVPPGFVGMMLDGPFFYPDMNQGSQMDLMVGSGVESVRTVFNWDVMQPYASFAQVPPSQRGLFTNVNGLPLNLGVIDQVVALAAQRRMSVLPVVEYTPPWDNRHPRNASYPPTSNTPYARFLNALVSRYGPRGSFWAAHPGLPRVPIRRWQIWNEPNFSAYWDRQPFERSYVKLLGAAHKAIHRADRGATVIMAGLANYSWRYLRTIYRVRGARRDFDAVAVHPYTATPAGAVKILRLNRAVMNAHGDRRKPMLATELSWPSARGVAHTNFENSTTEAGQAQKVAQAVRLMARVRRSLHLLAFYYYTWITNETLPGARVDPFNFAGLFRFLDSTGQSAKPVFGTFTRSALGIEGCKRKSGAATNCGR